LQEHFDLGRANKPHFRNQWLNKDDLQGFKSFMEDVYLKLAKVSFQILNSLELAYGLPKGTFTALCSHDKNASELRLNYYPPAKVQDFRTGTVNRIWPHFDLGVITLLFQDTVGGLEIENRDVPESFVPIRCDERTELVVNISETLQRWTGDCLRAGLHTVTIPDEMKLANNGVVPERYSVAYFCKANEDASVRTLSDFRLQGSPVYDDMSALQYHQKRLGSAYD
jgi:isopenicillin N synthase-like dioxygenase